MSYNPYNSSTPPRPFRIVFGFVIAAAGLIAGMTGAVHEFHKASVMQGEPVEMDWQTLVAEGYGDNPHIRLVNVTVIDPYVDMDELFEDEDLDALMDDPLVRSHMHTGLGPAKVVPIGTDESDVESRVFIAQGEHFLDEAFRQVDETNSVTGMVSTYGVGQMIADFVSFCTGNEVQGPPEDDDVYYTIVPIDGTPDLGFARNLFLTAGFALALGLIFCGSGGPGIWCCWYAPLPSVLSLIGYPMRYGRGSWSTRLTYIAGGAILMGYGFYLLVPMGNFGSTDGNPIFHAFGFATLFVGLGGILAVPLQITTRALCASVEVQPKKKPVRMSWNQACSMEPVIQEVEYTDPPLVPSGTLPLSGELKQKAAALAEAGFNEADPLQWQREAGIAAAAIQLGCQSMVVTDLEYNNDADIVECGLISVLGTGLPIITVSANSSVKQNRPSAKCLFQRASSSDPTEMLAEHLEVTVREAEQRDTIVVEFDESETHDVVRLARRVLAEIQGTMDGQIVNVGPKRYGRFHYPPAPVPEFVPSSV
ncbi:hypothetical protein Mal15_17470 [Stieleria maiorica]|uniref:Uncharacterized protein n=1 Tax=Stieleria maiorica TaxID=2795974 RepID=A0A5B9MDM3_9BACT|nr:hypothetical protein [Stieleria maiorica]QEF97704.1 hypothetical protein Mal15_17470 [Stieleria maiorica]